MNGCMAIFSVLRRLCRGALSRGFLAAYLINLLLSVPILNSVHITQEIPRQLGMTVLFSGCLPAYLINRPYPERSEGSPQQCVHYSGDSSLRSE